MISDTFAPFWFILGVVLSGILFGISTFIDNTLLQSISFTFMFAMLFVCLLSPKSMWKYNAQHSNTKVSG